MGTRIRSRSRLQRSAAARSRAATRKLGGRKSQRRSARTKVSHAKYGLIEKYVTSYITVNRGIIDSNRKHGTNRPPVRVSTGKYGKIRYGFAAFILGPASVIYEPKNPLPHGARLWIETVSPVLVS